MGAAHGCYLSIDHPDRVDRDLAQWGTPEDIDYIVVTDGEEILGIGDQGVGGILISVAKLVLMTLCAGIHPNRTLPVVLDCGTDNEELLNDDLYLGLKKKRVRGQEYDDLVDTFVTSARKRCESHRSTNRIVYLLIVQSPKGTHPFRGLRSSQCKAHLGQVQTRDLMLQ